MNKKNRKGNNWIRLFGLVAIIIGFINFTLGVSVFIGIFDANIILACISIIVSGACFGIGIRRLIDG